uniref:C2H2-type domain-containing protein n=1 Tax=Macrostomum lignano TaxID=282301 RepID=A0A1I8FAW4_9PLAT
MKRLQRAEARQQFPDFHKTLLLLRVEADFIQRFFELNNHSASVLLARRLSAPASSAMNSGGGGSPFYHCQLCTKAYSSEKSLNKHMRKKHGIGRDQQQIHRSPSAKPSKASTEETVQSPSKI